MGVDEIIVLCLIVVWVVIAVCCARSKSRRGNRQAVSVEDDQAAELTKRFTVGKYLSGLPGFSGEASLVSCGVTEENFEFRKELKGSIIGSIPRKGIKNVSVVKRGKNNSVSIRWSNGHNVTYDAVFIFDSKKSEIDAIAAAENLKAWIKGNVSKHDR
jgi:hypothetical protein